ncbi:hypothetical protein ACFYUY_39405 [Kitasatospora sp. NPDC004745]|uniref:WXG100 family type VII secretion target n=1 Tax=Kitasatospora sp. NPDC004745 TaxID=3364019 RepID=UPI0036B6E2CD
MPLLWEDILTAFNPRKSGVPVEIVRRADVAGPKAAPWLTGNFEVLDGYFSADQKAWDGSGTGVPDVWWAMNFYDGAQKKERHFRVSIHIDYSKWGNDPTGPLSKFNHQAELILGPIRPDVKVKVPAGSTEKLAISTRGNDTIHPQSLLAAATAIDDSVKWLTMQAKAAREWASKINSSGDTWEGDAAGEFKILLQRFAGELDDLQNQLVGANYKPMLETAAQQIGVTIEELWTAQQAWYATGFPYQCILEELVKVMHAHAPDWTGETTGWKFDTPFGDPHNAEFYTALDAAAKTNWLAKVQTGLDGPGNTAMTALDTAYQPLINKLFFGLLPVGITLPPKDAPDPGTGTGGGPPPPGGGDGSETKLGGDGSGGAGDKSDLGGGTGLGGDHQNTGGGGGGTGHVPPPVIGGIGTGGSGGTGGTGGGTGAGTPILDKDGKPLLDKDRKPVLLPPGGYIGDGGKVYDANGKEVLGKDGKPVVVPPGAYVPAGSGGGVYGPNAKVPKGSTVKEDGSVVDADGKPVLDANGNPVVVEKGSSVAADGTLLDPQKKPISDYLQRVRDQQRALASSGGGTGSGGLGNWTGGAGSGGPGNWTGGNGSGGLDGGSRWSGSDPASWTLDPGTVDGTSGTGSLGLYPGLFGSGGTQEGIGGAGANGSRIVGTASGLGPRALENGGPVPTVGKGAMTGSAAAAEKAAASQKAAAELAAEEAAALRGRTVNTSGAGGMPMVPPMAGGMGGTGQGEKGRQRTTWLAEDEEVWGTDTGAVSGVIGR